jgi:glycosyltransferase involved in cell wall biosynthesis
MLVAEPRVSVVMPVYGRPSLALEAVASIVQQTVAVELIVVDDGSAEDMTAVWRAVECAGGIYVQRPHEGIARARNAGAALASRQWLAFVDSDDVLLPNKLRAQVSAVEAAKAAWGFCGYEVTDRAGGRRAEQRLRRLEDRFWLHACPFGATALLLDRLHFHEVGGFDTSFEVCEDWDLIVRLGASGAPAAVAEPLYAYRLDCGNITASNDEMWYRGWRQLCDKHGIRPSLMSYPGIGMSWDATRRFERFCRMRAA